MNYQETIVAIATPPGKGGIGVVRISGKNLKPLAQVILGFVPEQRYAHHSNFYGNDGQVIDRGIAIYFVTPHSYTGEDVLELQGHGSPAIMNLLLSRCMTVGARLAQPGEFTLRAFLNGKLDLIQAESVADIINATSEQAAHCAVQSLQGIFSKKIYGLVAAITELRVLIEATLDFPEEETENLHALKISKRLVTICATLQQIFDSSRQGSLLQEGIRIVLVGEPNVGKSSLMNQLAEDDVSIVTEIPGTTRDAVQQTIHINGVPLHLIDTAGLRETGDIVEQSGIVRTFSAIEKADMLLLVVDSSNMNTDDIALPEGLPSALPRITIYNKIDLLKKEPAITEDSGGPVICLSAKTGEGLPLLRQKLLSMAGWQGGVAGEGIFMARQRHLEALYQAKVSLRNAVLLAEELSQLDLLAEELRLAQQALSTITGEYTADDLLGEIFSSFCIGK
ncbi:MAG: tRNA modification GTPase MnmE [Nitrosomonas sp.]|nr:MAG: tRNA modification GTPase MnmE [Nitrosomonas sp.]